jgi:hypothetical protein
MNSKLLCLPICVIASQLSKTSSFTYLWSDFFCGSIFMIILVTKEIVITSHLLYIKNKNLPIYRTKQFTITSYGDARPNGKECPSASKLIKEYDKHIYCKKVT